MLYYYELLILDIILDRGLYGADQDQDAAAGEDEADVDFGFNF